MNWIRYFLAAMGYLALLVPPAFGGTTWEAANQAYQNGKYEAAKVNYLQLVRAGQYSAELFYNLGNVWFKLGDQGRAILNYERALLLNPSLEEAGSNLRTVLKIVGNDDQPTLRDRIGVYADYFPLAASIAFWIFAFSIFFASQKYLRFIVFWRRLCIVAGFVFLLSAAACVWIGSGAKEANRALIIGSAADLKYGPAVSARSVESLQIGERVQLISERGDWTFCRASTGDLGWILTRKAERIVP
ncbi:MAG: tetratricopeptide repeat protein [Verrucomicrobia bacterium]|nr:tetratricopeptide repeat protein [Verrucomicrobiota bacterium]